MGSAARKYQEVHACWDKGKVTEEERLYIMQQDIRDFFFTCQQWNDAPNIRQFLNDHEEWDHERYLDAIEAEFKRNNTLTPTLGRMEA